MKLVLEPKVYLIDRQTVDDEAVWSFLGESVAPNCVTDTQVSAEELVEIAGRTCSMSFDNLRLGGNKGYIDHLLQMGHGSVLEHGMFAFIETAVSRILPHELVRHGTAGHTPRRARIT